MLHQATNSLGPLQIIIIGWHRMQLVIIDVGSYANYEEKKYTHKRTHTHAKLFYYYENWPCFCIGAAVAVRF